MVFNGVGGKHDGHGILPCHSEKLLWIYSQETFLLHWKFPLNSVLL